MKTCPLCFKPEKQCNCTDRMVEKRKLQIKRDLLKSRLESIENQMVGKASLGAFKEADKLMEQKKTLVKQLKQVNNAL